MRCKVLPGLFESEYYILLNGSSAAYVDRRNVQIKVAPKHGTQVDGRVLVYVIDRRKDKSLVELAGEAVVGGLRSWVPNTELSTAGT